MMFPFCISIDHQRLQLQISPSWIPYWPAVIDLRDSSWLRGKWLQRHVPCRNVLPPLGGSLWGGCRRLLYPGAALWREVGLSRDGEGWGGLQGLQSEPVRLRGSRAESGGIQPLCKQASVLPSHREMQLPAVLYWRQRREGLHCVSARNLSLWQRQVSV